MILAITFQNIIDNGLHGSRKAYLISALYYAFVCVILWSYKVTKHSSIEENYTFYFSHIHLLSGCNIGPPREHQHIQKHLKLIDETHEWRSQITTLDFRTQFREMIATNYFITTKSARLDYPALLLRHFVVTFFAFSVWSEFTIILIHIVAFYFYSSKRSTVQRRSVYTAAPTQAICPIWMHCWIVTRHLSRIAANMTKSKPFSRIML